MGLPDYNCIFVVDMTRSASNKRYTPTEERVNTLSHAVGAVLGLVAGYFLITKALDSKDPWAMGCVIVYLGGMLASYVTSTLYHGCNSDNRKEKLRKFDHAAISLHIAATYTPFTLLVLRHDGLWGWGIFACVWLLTIAGFIFSFTRLKEHSHLETAGFICMGCCILVAIKPLLDNLTAMNAVPAFWWLIGGGVSYITGALFYSRPRVKFMHATFHIFCLGGSICHIIAIWMIL